MVTLIAVGTFVIVPKNREKKQYEQELKYCDYLDLTTAKIGYFSLKSFVDLSRFFLTQITEKNILGLVWKTRSRILIQLNMKQLDPFIHIYIYIYIIIRVCACVCVCVCVNIYFRNLKWIYLYKNNPVNLFCRIRRPHLYWGTRHLHLMVNLHSRSFVECGLPLRCHYSQVNSDSVRVSSMGKTEQVDYLIY